LLLTLLLLLSLLLFCHQNNNNDNNNNNVNNNNNNDNTDTDMVVVTCQDGRIYQAPKVIVTTSIKVLQSNNNDDDDDDDDDDDAVSLLFVPELPEQYRNAINAMTMLPGVKAFLKFKFQFYPDAFALESDKITASNERYFYNALLHQPTSTSTSNNTTTTSTAIMGVFMIGDIALEQAGKDPDDVIDDLLTDLEAIFSSDTVRSAFLGGIVQDWTSETYIGGAYTSDIPNQQQQQQQQAVWRSVDTLRQPIQQKLYFAGEAIPVDEQYEWGFVHGAAFSGRKAAATAVADLMISKTPLAAAADDDASSSSSSSSSPESASIAASSLYVSLLGHSFLLLSCGIFGIF